MNYQLGTLFGSDNEILVGGEEVHRGNLGRFSYCEV